MSVTGRYWYVFVLLLLTRRSIAASEIDEGGSRQFDKSKQSLRHQQNRRPSFIARKITDSLTARSSREDDVDTPNDELISPRVEASFAAPSSARNERLQEDGLEKPAMQIRHGRSRSYLARAQAAIAVDESRPILPRRRNRVNSTVIADEPELAWKSDNDASTEDFRSVANDSFDARKLAEESSIVRPDEPTSISRRDPGDIKTIDRRAGSEGEVRRVHQAIYRNDSLRVLKSILAGNHGGSMPIGLARGNSTEVFGLVVRGAFTDPADEDQDGENSRGHLGNVDEDQDGENSRGHLGNVDEDQDGENFSRHLGNVDEDQDDENFSRHLGNVDEDQDDENFRRHFENVVLRDYEDYEKTEETSSSSSSSSSSSWSAEKNGTLGRGDRKRVQVDIVTRFLRIIENQHLLGGNCTAGTDLNLGEGVVDRYAQERFRLEANFAVNRANMLTRLWKYAPDVMLASEYLLHASVLSMVEFDEDIFAAGNCYDKLQYKDRWLYCPFAHRLQDQDGVLVKDLAIQYKYLSNSSEWFYIARKNAEKVIASNDQHSRGYHSYTRNESADTTREEDEILAVRYEDGRWSKPYYDCGGGNIWMLTYTVPFFGYANDTYFFKGTSGIDIDLRKVDIDQCPLPLGSTQLNIFAASDKCKKRTTECVAIPGLGFRRGSYRCICKRGFYFPDTKSNRRYYNGTVIEEEYEKLMMGEASRYGIDGVFECLPCAEGCESCVDDSPCVVSLNWLMRTVILILECCVIACLPIVALFTWKYGNVKVVRAASPVLLRVIVLGAFFIYCTTIVMYPQPNIVTCTVRVWFREIGFSLTYGALMLKTWRISVIFRVKSAKAVKITDASLLKRLGIIVMVFSVFLGIRTIVAPPVVIVGRTADDLKAYLCRTDWWDHSFTTLEVMFLIWGIRLCIVVRKTPSEFNESRFISMAIYNEFLLSVFLNVSMLFLQSPANPDLLYIIFFCHTQLTVTLLLCLIFGSKVYVVFRSGGKDDAKPAGTTGKFFGKSCRPQGTSNQTNSMSLQQGNFTDESDGTTEEFRRLLNQLEMLKEKHILLGNNEFVRKITAMQEAGNRVEAQVSTIQAISSSMGLNDLDRPITIIAKTNERPSSKSVANLSRTGSVYREGKQCRACSDANDVVVKQTSRQLRTPSNSSLVQEESRSDRKASGQEVIASSGGLDDEEDRKNNAGEETRSRSGHARTHAIIINLDDKSRFSEEVTV